MGEMEEGGALDLAGQTDFINDIQVHLHTRISINAYTHIQYTHKTIKENK